MAGARERRFWLAAAACLAVIYAAIYPGQFLLQALRDRGLLRWSIAVLFLAAGAALLAAAARLRPGRREWAVLAAAAVAYVALTARLPVLQERLHFLEYGLLAACCEAALRERQRVAPLAGSLRASGWALLVVAACGWGDEAIQLFVPHRVYDLRDVGLNAGAGALALVLLAARRAARRRDLAALCYDPIGGRRDAAAP